MSELLSGIDHRLSPAFSRWSLLESKFYQAWSAGTLPIEALAQYSREYGGFIRLIGDGWAAHGDSAIAAEEREHAELWQDFARGLGTEVGEAETPAVQMLLERMRLYFSAEATSIGALYAFELQQPRTAQSKLEGLKAFYPSVPGSSYKYFEIHCRDDEEPALLRTRLAELAPMEREQALVACEETVRLLREALDGLYDANCCVSDSDSML